MVVVVDLSVELPVLCPPPVSSFVQQAELTHWATLPAPQHAEPHNQAGAAPGG